MASADSGGPARTGVILPTGVGARGRHLTSKTDIHHLQDENAALFQTFSNRYVAQTMKVVGL